MLRIDRFRRGNVRARPWVDAEAWKRAKVRGSGQVRMDPGVAPALEKVSSKDFS